jgi:hypothetical protein
MKLEVHYCVHNSPVMAPIVSQMNHSNKIIEKNKTIQIMNLQQNRKKYYNRSFSVVLDRLID